MQIPQIPSNTLMPFIKNAAILFIANLAYWQVAIFNKECNENFNLIEEKIKEYKENSNKLSMNIHSSNTHPICLINPTEIDLMEAQKVYATKVQILSPYMLMFSSGPLVNGYVNILFKMMPLMYPAVNVGTGITFGIEVMKLMNNFYEFNVVKILANFSYHAGVFCVRDYLTNSSANVAIKSINLFFGALTLRITKEAIEEFYNSGDFVISNISSKYSSAINKVLYFLDANVFEPQFKTIGITMTQIENIGYITSGFYEVLDKPLTNALKEAVNILEVTIDEISNISLQAYKFYQAFTSTPDNNTTIIQEL